VTTVRRLTLTQWILVSMVVGVVLGVVSPRWAIILEPLSVVFLRMIKSLIVPLIFSTLVVGVAGHGDDMGRVGRLAVRSFVYFEVVTTIALFVGLVVVNIVQPGRGVSLTAVPAEQGNQLAGQMTTLSEVLEHIVPVSVFDAAAHNEALQVVFWALLFAVALSRVRGPAKERILGLCEGLAEVTFRMVAIVMVFAPIGIGSALAATIGHHGLGVLGSLGKLVLTIYIALIIFCALVFVPIILLAKVPLGAFVRAVRGPALIAFSTSTSEAALPLSIENMVAMGVPRRIAAFVIPAGYTFNLDGSTLYLAVALLFAAQAAGLSLPIGRQLIMMLTLMLMSKGVAGVPRASLVILAGALVTFGLPAQAVALILGVDAFMDMARTTVNVVGNCVASAVLARWEGELGAPDPALVAASD
jgi:proton glutamate symport protein